MKAQRRNTLAERITRFLVIPTIYVTLWVSGFHDTQRRWILLLSLFGLVVAQELTVDLVRRLRRDGDTTAAETMARGGRIPYLVGSMAVMLVIGLVLRFTL